MMNQINDRLDDECAIDDLRQVDNHQSFFIAILRHGEL